MRWLLLLLMVLAGPAWGQSYPKFTGLVVDAADVIPDDRERALNAKLEQLQRTTRNQLVVATVPGLGGYPIEDYANGLFRTWSVGLRDVNNGALLLIAPGERKVRIEVGYGLEPVVTDAFSSVTINEAVLPRFKAGDLPGGIEAGADRLAEQLALPAAEATARTTEAARRFDATHRRRSGGGSGGGAPVAMIFFMFVFFAVVLPMLRGRKHGARGQRYRGGGGGSAWPIVLWTIANELNDASRHSRGGGGGWGGGDGGGGGGWSGGWGDGGFSGGGGGSSGGGGASGSW